MLKECKLVNINSLKAHEKVLPRYLAALIELIKSDGFVKNPIIIDEGTNTVLDGSHRFVSLLSLGCKLAPVIEVNYYDPSVSIGSRRSHRFRVDKPIPMSKGAVLWASLTNNLLPPRSSRHFFKFRKLIEVNIPLEELGYRTPPDVSKYIVDWTLEQEIKDLQEYIEECNEDLVIIEELKVEVCDIREDLLSRLEKMEK